jgi:hypothetical protein
MNVLSRPYEAFPSLAPQIKALLETGWFAPLPRESFLVYGSTVRALWTRETAPDINVAFVGGAGRAAQPSFPAPARSLRVRADPYESVEEAVLEADFTICQAVFYNGCLHFSEPFFEHVAQRLLVVNRIRPETALSSLLRTYKFTQRGYSMTQATLAEILRHLPREIPALLPDEVMGHSGAVVL